MAVVDLSAHRLAPLDIAVGGGVVYEIRPTADDLRRMGVFSAAAERSVKAGTKEDAPVSSLRDLMDPDDYDLLDSNESLCRVQLGSVAYDRMVKDGVPAPDIIAFGRYSMNYHTRGQAFADAVLTMVSAPESGDGGAEFPKRLKSGRSTGSASRAKTARTAGTGSSRRTSAQSSTAKRR